MAAMLRRVVSSSNVLYGHSCTARRWASSSSSPASALKNLIEASANTVDDVETGNLWIGTEEVSVEEANSLVEEVHKKLQKWRYDKGHFDGVIVNYREVEQAKWNSQNELVLSRLRQRVQNVVGKQLTFLPTHVIDLNDTGYIKPHIDHVKYSGEVVAGLSLVSESVMQLVSASDPTKVVRMLLPTRSLYVQTGVFRYGYTHEICNRAGSPTFFQERLILPGRRISLMLRDVPLPE